jgi:hypothetical protein
MCYLPRFVLGTRNAEGVYDMIYIRYNMIDVWYDMYVIDTILMYDMMSYDMIWCYWYDIYVWYDIDTIY